MKKSKTKPKQKPTVISIKTLAAAAPLTTLLIRPKPLTPDHYLLQSLITLWKQNSITTTELNQAYFDVDHATRLFAFTEKNA